MSHLLWPPMPNYSRTTFPILLAMAHAEKDPSGLEELALAVGLSPATMLRAVRSIDPSGEKMEVARRMAPAGADLIAARECLLLWAEGQCRRVTGPGRSSESSQKSTGRRPRFRRWRGHPTQGDES